ncbi:hypothetical protein JL720_4092 [Aureococcus anophagefferens]|nr:hypothetical protein JL720_4092 [Aureococcus anophagefferens]
MPAPSSSPSSTPSGAPSPHPSSSPSALPSSAPTATFIQIESIGTGWTCVAGLACETTWTYRGSADACATVQVTVALRDGDVVATQTGVANDGDSEVNVADAAQVDDYTLDVVCENAPEVGDSADFEPADFKIAPLDLTLLPAVPEKDEFCGSVEFTPLHFEAPAVLESGGGSCSASRAPVDARRRRVARRRLGHPKNDAGGAAAHAVGRGRFAVLGDDDTDEDEDVDRDDRAAKLTSALALQQPGDGASKKKPTPSKALQSKKKKKPTTKKATKLEKPKTDDGDERAGVPAAPPSASTSTASVPTAAPAATTPAAATMAAVEKPKSLLRKARAALRGVARGVSRLARMGICGGKATTVCVTAPDGEEGEKKKPAKAKAGKPNKAAELTEEARTGRGKKGPAKKGPAKAKAGKAGKAKGGKNLQKGDQEEEPGDQGDEGGDGSNGGNSGGNDGGGSGDQSSGGRDDGRRKLTLLLLSTRISIFGGSACWMANPKREYDSDFDMYMGTTRLDPLEKNVRDLLKRAKLDDPSYKYGKRGESPRLRCLTMKVDGASFDIDVTYQPEFKREPQYVHDADCLVATLVEFVWKWNPSVTNNDIRVDSLGNAIDRTQKMITWMLVNDEEMAANKDLSMKCHQRSVKKQAQNWNLIFKYLKGYDEKKMKSFVDRHAGIEKMTSAPGFRGRKSAAVEAALIATLAGELERRKSSVRIARAPDGDPVYDFVIVDAKDAAKAILEGWVPNLLWDGRVLGGHAKTSRGVKHDASFTQTSKALLLKYKDAVFVKYDYATGASSSCETGRSWRIS